MKFNFFIAVLILVTFATVLLADDKSITSSRFEVPPVIDGSLDDAQWKMTVASGGMIQISPDFGLISPVRTVLRIGYDNKAIYVAVYCYDPEPDKIAAAVTSRDGSLDRDDAVAIMFDTFLDRTNGYYFVVNSIGTQLDGRIADNGRTDDDTWDAEWQAAASKVEDGWTAELAIPFKSLKFKGQAGQSWGLQVARSFPRRREVSTWNGPTENLWRTSRFGLLNGLDLSNQESGKIQVIPYVQYNAGENQKSDGEAGVNLRYRLTNTLGADLTLNPDFALVEADVEEINLSRFELRIPEKRPFFLEGSQLLRQRIRQFYSRRIGDVPWGMKATGKSGDFDVYVLAAQSEPIRSRFTEEEATYSVGRFKRSVFGSSNIGLLAANSRFMGENKGSIGLDTTLFFTETLGMTAQFIRAHGPENDGALAWFIRPSFDSANSHFHVRYTNLDEGLMENMNAVGFLRDDNRKEFDTNIRHEFWIQEYGIESIEGSVNYNRYWGQEGDLRSWEIDSELEINLSSRFEIEINQIDEFKVFEKDFRNYRTGIDLSYDSREGRSAFVSYAWGRNFDSDLKLYGVGTSLKINDAWNASYSIRRLELEPDPDNDTTWIHVLRSSYHFDNDLFLKLFFQTNSVIDKKNLQVLFVWRFIPPFGAVQLAFQRGTSEFGERSDQGNTIFSKLSFVF